MATTDAMSHGGLALAGSADTFFVHGPQVDSDIEVLWDFDDDGDFDTDEENVTSYLYDGDSLTGRDWPSQLQGKAGPGRLRLSFNNDDGRFSYFNTDSPLNTDGRSLDPGRKIRVQIAGTTDVDPVELARDRFDSRAALEEITTDEHGTVWTHRTPSGWVKGTAQQAIATSEGAEHFMTLDVGAADYYVQMTIAELGDNVLETVGLQEINEVRLVYRYQDDSNYSYLAARQDDNVQVLTLEGVDVVAGTPATIFGPGTLLASGDDSEGEHGPRATLGVRVAGAVADYYFNGALITITPETALQTDETEVGIWAYWGFGNRRPAVDEFAVWDDLPTSTVGVIWTGHVTDVFPEAPAPKALKVVTVTAEGTLAQLAAADIRPQAWAGQHRTGIALGESLQVAGMLYPPGEIARGTSRAGSSSDAEINALAHARKLEEVEVGFLHEAPEGWLVFEDRAHRDDLEPVATFSDAVGAQFGYHEIKLLQWRKELINKVSAGVSYGAPNIPVVGGFGAASTAAGVARSIPWTFPVSVNDGDLFVVIITSTIDDDDENWIVPLWWVRERDTGASSSRRTQIYTHIAAASEAGSTVTFYNDTAGSGGSYITGYYQIRDWYGTHEGIEIGPWSVGEAYAGADPEAIQPAWGDTNPTIFIAQRAGTSVGSAGAVTNPTFPLGYVNSASRFQNGTINSFDCGMELCSKLAMTALEDASTFTGFTNLNNAETSVIAIRGRNGSPPEPRGRLRVEAEDIDSQRTHRTIVSYDGCDLFPDEDAAEEWCQLMLTRYSRLRPILRLSFTATISSSYRTLAYSLRLSDKVRVVATGDAGMGIDADFHVESIAHSWSNAGKLWRVTVELSPA